MTTVKQNPGISVQRKRSLISKTVFAILLLLVGCSLRRGPEDALVFEPILSPVGLIFEYEISPEGKYAAILVPTEAAEPGSEAYRRIMQTGVWSNQQILVFDLATGEVVRRSTATHDNVVSLRWSVDSAELLYLTWPSGGSGSETKLVRWSVLTGTTAARSFPHTGFDLADDGSSLAAWGVEHLAIESNKIQLYDFPSLNEIASYILADVRNIEHIDWAADSSWLLVDSGPELLRLELGNGTVEKIVESKSVSVFPPLLDSTNRFLLGSGVGVNLFDLQKRCVVLHLEAEGVGNAFAQAEWSRGSGTIYIVLEENEAAQQTIQRVDIGELLETNNLTCLSAN